MEKLLLGARKLGINLTPGQFAQFQRYYQELEDWNRRVNLTAIVDYEEVQLKHFLDSLTISLALRPPGGGGLGELKKGEFEIMDVGSGAGLPGLPLKIVFPDIKLALLDSVAKKTAFLSHLVVSLELQGVEVITGRAEEVAHRPGYRERFDLVLSRAVAPLPTLVELTLPFCRIGGKLVAQEKGEEWQGELEKARWAIEMLGVRLREVRAIELEEFDDRRLLVIIDKVSPTPEKYPRRPGLPARRPLFQTRPFSSSPQPLTTPE